LALLQARDWLMKTSRMLFWYLSAVIESSRFFRTILRQVDTDSSVCSDSCLRDNWGSSSIWRWTWRVLSLSPTCLHQGFRSSGNYPKIMHFHVTTKNPFPWEGSGKADGLPSPLSPTSKLRTATPPLPTCVGLGCLPERFMSKQIVVCHLPWIPLLGADRRPLGRKWS
jgi:hypothetical protein